MKRGVQENLIEKFSIKCHRHSVAGDEAHTSRHFIAFRVFVGKGGKFRIDFNSRNAAITNTRRKAKACHANTGAKFNYMAIFRD